MSVLFKGYDDGNTLNTDLLHRAIYDYAGKETLVIPEGVYLTGPLMIPSDSHIILEKGAVLKFADDFDLYPPVKTRWEGVDCYAMHPCVWIENAENVILEGEGTLNGGGEKWWSHIMTWKNGGRPSEPVLECEKRLAVLNPDYRNQASGGGGRECQFLRPPLLQIYRSRNVTVKGITLTSSPFWNLHPVYSDNVILDGVKIVNPSDSPNTDGIDVESCNYVTIRNCFVDVGDDGIALKSGSGLEALKTKSPTTHVLVEGCTVKSAHGGFTIGSETACGFEDVTVRNCNFDGTDRGVRIKTRRGRGGHIRNIRVSDITMKNVICPITIMMFYKCGSDDSRLYSLFKQPIDETTPIIEDITVSGVRAQGCRAGAGLIAGLPEMPVKNVSISDCVLLVSDRVEEGLETEMFAGLPETDYRGFRIAFAENVRFENNTVNVEPPLKVEDLEQR